MKLDSRQVKKWSYLRAALLASAALFLLFSQGWFNPAAERVGASIDRPKIVLSSATTINGTDEDESGSTCIWGSAAYPLTLHEQAVLSGIPGGDIRPLRWIVDPYPELNGIAVDPVNNEVIVSDQNLKSLLIYDRSAGKHSPDITEPLRHIIGPQTGLGFIAGVAIDPIRREYYSANNDVENKILVFSKDADGNTLPLRVLYTPNLAWGISLDSENNELAITTQELNAVFVYSKDAKGVDAPLRVIRGTNTGMADPRGIFIDSVHDEIIVANHGSRRDETTYYPYAKQFGPLLPSTGRYQEPSLSVYSRTSQGNQTALRKIQGPDTKLKWPMGVHGDPENNEIAVANNADNSILVFRRTDSGNAKPIRTIRGPKTHLDHPIGVYMDRKNDELWVANFGNHSATVYPLNANGDITPRRIIRNAPSGTPTVGLGNPMALAYDPNREEILVPN